MFDRCFLLLGVRGIAGEGIREGEEKMDGKSDIYAVVVGMEKRPIYQDLLPWDSGGRGYIGIPASDHGGRVFLPNG